MCCARSEAGFTTVELLLAVMILCVGIIALIATLDVSQRATHLAEMKETASHIAEQNLEQIRILRYDALALAATPAGSTDPKNPGYYVGSSASGPTYRWNQKSDAPSPHTEQLVIKAGGGVAAAASTWTDGRISGKVYRYVTAVNDPSCSELLCPGDDYKRVTVAVTVDNRGGPPKPILVSSLAIDPSAAIGGVVNGSVNPLNNPSTKCVEGGALVDCERTIPGTGRTYYLYDTPATQSARQGISGDHATHATVAPTGSCPTAGNIGSTSGCPVPDLMGADPPPSSTELPALYKYSTEITGGSWPGGAVLRRDVACEATPSATDNTKGHLWVTAPAAAPMTLTGDAALNLSTATFGGVAAGVTLCVRFYDVPASLTNLVASPPTAIGTGSHTQSSWPQTPETVGFVMDFRGSSPDYTIAQGRRLGVRVWPASAAGADIAAIYDHPSHASFVQVNEAE